MAIRTVSIVCKSLPKYRIPLMEMLRLRLEAGSCRLRVFYGPPSAEEERKADTGELEWGERIPTRYIQLGSHQLYWQPCLRRVWRSDLVVVEQASKLLLNYVLLAAQYRGGPPVAFWGHGRNFQLDAASRFGEVLKRSVSRYPHWWFAYTEGSAATVRQLGYPAERITVLQNAIDTATLREFRGRLPASSVSSLRKNLGISGTNVALFIGGLYQGKRLDFLISAAHIMRRLLPDFELLVVGAGPAEDVIRHAAATAPWIHHLGPHFDQDKIPFFALAKVLVLPAVAGLTVLDSFALEVPIVTLAGEHHPPEFEYLLHGVNAVIVPGRNAESYAKYVVDLLQSDDIRAELRAQCRVAAERYTLEAMVERFATGSLAAIASERRR